MSTQNEDERSTIKAWKLSRSGAWAGRGFHYQHLISTLILIRQWAGLAPAGHIVPEGMQDCVVELASKSIWLQIKSRKDNPFRAVEVEQILASMDTKAVQALGQAQSCNFAVFEQPCTSMSETSIDQLFEDTSERAFVCTAPGEECVAILSTQLDTAEVIADGIVSDLYRLVADASQANAFLPYEKKRKISSTEVERRIFERLEAEDPTAIDHALASGVLEPVDFINPICEPAFYQGVKVKPGHIAAGLVVDRPDDMDDVIKALKQRRHVLVSGPSGAGKSALMWMSANGLAGELRWYQITARAVTADADIIIRFIRARRPSEKSPIGLAFDEVGSTNNDLWDVLVRELRGLPDVYFLGSVRQEDVMLIANQSDTEFIPVSLTEKLAESVWMRLYAEKQTNWEHWLEPFEQSKGLMLEYVHLLTQGQRLAAVIDEQVQQRQREGRYDELAIIRSTAVIFAHGGEVQVAKLLDLHELKPVAASQSLKRLINEHLIREAQPGILSGLHILRSQALSEASHDDMVYLAATSLWQALRVVTSDTLPKVIQSILKNAPDEVQIITLRKLAETLATTADIDIWTAVLTGLGLATLEKSVDSFIDILEQHEVQRAQWSLASMFSDPEIDIPDLTEFDTWQRLQDAIQVFRAKPKYDLRRACLDQFLQEIPVLSCQDLKQANRLLSCLAPICGCEPLQIPLALNFLENGEQDIRQIAALLSTAHLIGLDMAENMVQKLGGEQVLFNWFRSQTPWVTTPQVYLDGEHGRTIRSDWFYVAEQEQPDPHERVCDICEILIAISPVSAAAASDAINPMGEPIEIDDFRPWSKIMPRQNIPAKTRVAWNIAFRKILLARSASDSLTEYTQKMAILVKRTEKVFRSFTEKWIRGKSIENADSLAEKINEIIDAVNALAYVTHERPEHEMTTPEVSAGNEDFLGALLTGVLGNLLRRMNKIPGEEGAKGAASFAGSLAMQARQQEKSGIWRTCTEPPLCELKALAERLSDVTCILHEMAFDDGQSSILGIIKTARKGRLGKAIHVTARRCRYFAGERFSQRLSALQIALEDKGMNVRCYCRPIGEADSAYWPSKEIAILVEVADFETDAGYIEDCLSIAHRHIGSDWSFRVAPVINGLVVTQLALLPSSHIALPDQDFADKWRKYIDSPFLKENIVERFDEALVSCHQLSAIMTCCDLEHLRQEEEDIFSKGVDVFECNFDLVVRAAKETSSEHLVWACEYLEQKWNQIVEEYEAAKDGLKLVEPLC